MEVEFLKKLGLSEDIIAKIQTESGKDITKEKEKTKKALDDLAAANGKLSEYEGKIAEFEKQDAAGLARQVADLQKIIDDRKTADDAALREKNLAERFERVTGERKYLNDFTKAGILSEFKAALEDKANGGKSDADVFDTLTKDREGVFINKNQAPDIPASAPSGAANSISREEFAKMGYIDRMKLYRENKELYNQLNEKE